MFFLALPAVCLISGVATAEGQSTATDASQRQGRHTSPKRTIDDRVKALARALDLDVTQQSEVKKLLENQREQVLKIWNDASMPAAYRVSATQAVSDQTSDHIRALLNDDQKKKYNPPRQPHEASAGSAKPSVEDWMNATRPK